MTDSEKDAQTVWQRIQYKIDNFFSGGGTRIVLALVPLFILAFTITASVRLLTNWIYPDPQDPTISGITAQLWRVLLQIMDIGAIEEESAAAYTNKALGVFTAIFGLLLFSTMLAIFSSLFKEKLESLRKGKSAVIESDHTLILGFNNRALEIIRELVEANASERDAVVVVLAEEDKEMMDDFFRYYLPNRLTTRIITRSGSTASNLLLKKLGVNRARSVIILNGAGPADPGDVKAQADYRVLKSILAILAVIKDSDKPHIVANLHFGRNRDLAEGIRPGVIVTIDDDTILAKILVQTSRISGLALIYADLVGFKGNEVYFAPIPEHLTALTFGKLLFHFNQSVPLGLRNGLAQIRLNPPPETKLSPGEEVILLAEDDSTIEFFDAPPVQPKPLAFTARKLETKIEKFLIIGWSNKSPILLEEYSSYIRKGSRIDIVVPSIDSGIQSIFDSNAAKYPHANVNLIESKYIAPNFPDKLNPHDYDTVVILAANGNNAEEIDSETIFLLLKFRQHFREKEKALGRPIQTRLISEIMDSDNIEIIQQTGVRDFLISNQLVSKIMAQLSEDPAVKMVYDDLFQEKGSEIYLKPASLYLDHCPLAVTFADVMLAAQQRNEICFGVKVAPENGQPNEERVTHIIPSKETVFKLHRDDLLITLAKDET